MRMIFANLPVADLSTARSFYGALGFSFNDHFADADTAYVVLDDNIVVGLVHRDPSAARQPVGWHTLTAVSRQEVDDLNDKALGAGGQSRTVPGSGRGYRKSFADPDENVWEILYLEPEHVID